MAKPTFHSVNIITSLTAQKLNNTWNLENKFAFESDKNHIYYFFIIGFYTEIQNIFR